MIKTMDRLAIIEVKQWLDFPVYKMIETMDRLVRIQVNKIVKQQLHFPI